MASQNVHIANTIIRLLMSTNRPGIKKLIDYLSGEKFFESPASTKFHGCYNGGLADHSLKVYSYLSEYVNKRKMKLDTVTGAGQKPLPIKQENLIIAGLLHDIFKANKYTGTKKPYGLNKQHPKGHALLSIAIIQKYIELEEIEILMIKYHMGVYGCNEFDEKQKGEYSLRGDHTKDESMSREDSKKLRYGQSLANAWFHNPVCKIISFCDEIETLEAKAAMETE